MKKSGWRESFSRSRGPHVLPQKVLINGGIGSFVDAKETNRTHLAVASHRSQHYLFQRGLGEGRDAFAGVHIGHREVRQVAAVGVIDATSPV
jgi:hypothetical protein